MEGGKARFNEDFKFLIISLKIVNTTIVNTKYPCEEYY